MVVFTASARVHSKSHRVHMWARLHTDCSGAQPQHGAWIRLTVGARAWCWGGGGGSGECRKGNVRSCSVSLKTSRHRLRRCVALAITTPSTGDAHCLSSNDPNAEARTSRSWDINSSPCVTKLWRTALLDTQRSHKLCQQHILLQSKHGYKTGSHHSSPAVCGSYSQCDYHL